LLTARWSILLGALMLTTGVALATPVSVLSMSDGTRELVERLDDGETLRFSYRQSIYDVLVFEEYERNGDRIELLRVRSSDVRSLEYLRWDGEIVQEDDGLWMQEAPAADVSELVIRIAPLGRQRFETARWTCDLLARFGERVIRVKADRVPLALALLRQVR